MEIEKGLPLHETFDKMIKDVSDIKKLTDFIMKRVNY